MLKIAASVKNFGRRTALRVVQSKCYFECARLPAAARRRTYMIGRRSLSPSEAKAMSILMEET